MVKWHFVSVVHWECPTILMLRIYLPGIDWKAILVVDSNHSRWARRPARLGGFPGTPAVPLQSNDVL
jgi:hypothetical protein